MARPKHAVPRLEALRHALCDLSTPHKVMLAIVTIACLFAVIGGTRGLVTVIWPPAGAADATLIRYDRHTTYDAESDTRHTKYQAYYEFADAAGQTHVVRSTNERDRPNPPVGTTTLMRYDPTDPEGTWVAQTESAQTAVMSTICVLVGLGMPALIAVYAVRASR